MITSEYICEMAAYTRWQNDNVFKCCDEIGPEERSCDRGMFFGSIHNTLDHICVVNRSILMFLDGKLPEQNPPGEAVWPDWEQLKCVRLEQDDYISKSTREWAEEWLSADVVLVDPPSKDFPIVPRWVMIVQLFNHQTHHRSQVTGALHFLGVDYGPTDIPWRPGAGFFSD